MLVLPIFQGEMRLYKQRRSWKLFGKAKLSKDPGAVQKRLKYQYNS